MVEGLSHLMSLPLMPALKDYEGAFQKRLQEAVVPVSRP